MINEDFTDENSLTFFFLGYIKAREASIMDYVHKCDKQGMSQRPADSPAPSRVVPRYSARLRYIAWTCMERVFFILTVWPSKIEMKK